jgi:ubiquinone biosynthesis protein
MMEVALPRRILAATDGSSTAGEAVRWAAALASQNDAELLLVRVLTPAEAPDAGPDAAVSAELAQLAVELAGARGSAIVLVDDDPARAIVRAAEEQKADLVVVGSAGMAGRKKFLLENVPNRVSHLSARNVVDFRVEAESLTRMQDVLRSYSRLGVPTLYSELSTGRVLVMEEISGVPIEAVPAGAARTEGARQLLESYFQQVIGAGFFHADPHPGNLVWRDDRLYFLDFGMVGEIDDHTRELLMLLLFALWRNDPGLLADVSLLLSGGATRVGPGFEKELGDLLTRYHDAPLADISLGVVLQEMTQTALRHGVRLPASLALASKALAQMQLAAAGLDPTLDPVAVAGSFISRLMLEKLREKMDPGKLVSEFMRFGMRASRLLEAIEHFTGSPGPEISIRGAEDLEKTIRQAGRRVAVGMGLAGVLVAGAIGARIRVAGARRNSTLV